MWNEVEELQRETEDIALEITKLKYQLEDENIENMEEYNRLTLEIETKQAYINGVHISTMLNRLDEEKDK